VYGADRSALSTDLLVVRGGRAVHNGRAQPSQ